MRYGKIKSWGKFFGVSKFGETKDELYSKLIEFMKKNPEECDEEMLTWYEEVTGKSKKAEPKKPGKRGRKKKEPVVEEKVEAPKKRGRKKVVKEEPVEPEKPKKRGRKKVVKEEEGPEVTITPDELTGFADELGLEYEYDDVAEGEEAARELAEKIIVFIDDELEESDREELSPELFRFYTAVRAQSIGGELPVDEATDPDPGVLENLTPSKVKLKVWANALDVAKSSNVQVMVAKILEAYKETDPEDRVNLPDSLCSWADVILGNVEAEVHEEEEVEQFELPEFSVLKKHAKAVGLRVKDIMRAKKDGNVLANMILEAYDSDEESEYAPELKDFYSAATEFLSGAEKSKTGWDTRKYLYKLGYEEDDLEDFDADECNQILLELYKEEEELSDEAMDFLKETFPEVFEPKKKRSPKRRKKVQKE